MTPTTKKHPEDCPMVDPETGTVDTKRWHINRGVDLGHLLLSISMLAGFLVYAITAARETQKLKDDIGFEKEHNARQDTERRQERDYYREDMKAVLQKLDDIQRQLPARRQ